MAKQLFHPAIYSCVVDDTALFVSWINQFSRSLSEGTLYPRWLALSHGGYGSPTFIFYPPLTVYITSLAKLVTGNLVMSVNMVKLAGCMFSGVFMYIFARGIWGPRAGLAAALAYIFMPYRVLDLYYLGTHSSKLAFIWFPLIMHLVRMTAVSESPALYSAGLSLAYCMLCLTHLLSAYMLAPLMLFYGMAAGGRGALARSAAKVLIAGFAGLLLAAFYIWPALAEENLVHFGALLGREVLHYSNNYLFNFRHAPTGEGLVFNVFIRYAVLTGLIFGVSGFMLARRRVNAASDTSEIFFLAAGAAALFLMCSPSGFLWRLVPGMRLLQFPFRWSSVLVLCMSCLVGAGVGRLGSNPVSRRSVLAGFWVLIFLLSVILVIGHDMKIVNGSCAVTTQEISTYPAGYDVTEYVPAGVSLDWLKNAEDERNAALVGAYGTGTVKLVHIERWDEEVRYFSVLADTDATVRVRTFNYPGWAAFVDGKPAVIGFEPVSDAILIPVAKGAHNVRLRFGPTPLRKAAATVSFISMLVVVAFLIYNIRKRPKAGAAAR